MSSDIPIADGFASENERSKLEKKASWLIDVKLIRRNTMMRLKFFMFFSVISLTF
jgi:hypothetical protein